MGGVPSLIVPLQSASYFAAVSASNMFAPALAALSEAFAITTGRAGQLGALSPLSWAIMAPVTGPLSDRFGRRPLLAIGLALMGIGSVLAALSPGVWSLAITRLLTGVGGACFGPTSYALIADVLPPAKRAPALGVVMAGFSAAALLGLPGIAFLTGWLGWRWAFAVLGAILVVLGGATWLICPPGRPPQERASTPAPDRGGNLGLLRRSPTMSAMLLGNLLHQASSAAVATYTAAFLVEHFDLSLQQVAGWLALIAAGSVAGSLMGGQASRRSPLAIAAIACATSAILAPLFLWGGFPLPIAAALAALTAFAQSVRLPAHLAVVSDAAIESRGAVLGLNATSNQTGYTIGAVVGGAILGITGYTGIGLLAGAVSAAACAVYTWVLLAQRRTLQTRSRSSAM